MNFIEFNGQIINVSNIVTIYKTNGVNARKNEFAIDCVVMNHSHVTEWYDNIELRNSRFDEIKKILLG